MQATASKPAPPGISRGIVRVGSHQVVSTFDVPLNTAMGGERATLRFGKQTLVVDFGKGQIVLDDVERVKLPTGAKEVEIEFLSSKLSIKADGEPLPLSPAPK